jgi:acetyl esterase/lipase
MLLLTVSFIVCHKEDPASPLISAILFPTGHKNLPPTYFQICGMDPLRDEGLIYERILREECAVKTRVDLYPGLPHGFRSRFPEAGFSKKQLEDSMAGMAWLLDPK